MCQSDGKSYTESLLRYNPIYSHLFLDPPTVTMTGPSTLFIKSIVPIPFIVTCADPNLPPIDSPSYRKTWRMKKLSSGLVLELKVTNPLLIIIGNTLTFGDIPPQAREGGEYEVIFEATPIEDRDPDLYRSLVQYSEPPVKLVASHRFELIDIIEGVFKVNQTRQVYYNIPVELIIKNWTNFMGYRVDCIVSLNYLF